MSHPWLKGIDWDNMESKMLLEENIPFTPSSGDNFNFLKVNRHLNEKDKNYKSYLKLINNSTFFNNFYYNCYSNNSKKSEESIGRDSTFNNSSNDRRNSSKNNGKLKIIKEKENNDENGTNEFTLSECEINGEESILFNRFSENYGRISDINDNHIIKRLSYSPKIIK